MVALGRPGAGEELLSAAGFVDVARLDVRSPGSSPTRRIYARALASTGPAYEAIQTSASRPSTTRRRAAAERVRDGLPLRAEIAVVGYLAHKPRRSPRRPRRNRVGAAARELGCRRRSGRLIWAPAGGPRPRQGTGWSRRPLGAVGGLSGSRSGPSS